MDNFKFEIDQLRQNVSHDPSAQTTGKEKRRDSVIGRMKRVMSSPLFNNMDDRPGGVVNYHSNRFELGVTERLEQDINRNILRNRSTANLRRNRSFVPKTPDRYIGDVRKRLRLYTVLDPGQLSGN